MIKLMCITCNKEFDDHTSAGEHAKKQKHYEFKIKSKNLA